jgi:sodium transport system permease protein
MWKRIQNIWFKELMDTTRDRKGMAQTLLLPVIIGLLYAALNPLLLNVMESRAEESSTQTLEVMAQGTANAGQELLDAMQHADIRLEEYSGDLAALVQEGDHVVGLIIPEGFGAAVTNEQPAQLRLLTNPNSGDVAVTSASIGRVQEALAVFEETLVAQRLAQRGIDPALLHAVNVENQVLTTPQQEGSFNARLMLPILIGIVVVTGGLFVALDVTAGEKERGTLEALLVTPATDAEIFGGKLLAVFSVTIVPLVLTFIAYAVSTNLLPESVVGNVEVPLMTVVGGIAVGIPLALAVNVLVMILAIRAKTIKDAQSAVTPISLGVLVPGLAPAFVPPSGLLAYLIPGYGSTAVLGEIAGTGQFPVAPYILSALTCLVFAGVGIAVALRLFDRERLLYSR